MLTEAEIDLIVQETRYGIDCPVSGNFNLAMRDAIMAGYRAGVREALAVAEQEVNTTRGLVQEARRRCLPHDHLDVSYACAWGVKVRMEALLNPCMREGGGNG